MGIPESWFSSGSAADAGQSIAIWLLRALVMITSVCVLVPFTPFMPTDGLDPSWVLGMNQAIDQGLVFGRDIIFTFGPYTSIYTKSYHAATDGLMVWGAIYLGVAFGSAVLLVFRNRDWYLQLGVVVILAGFIYQRDIFLFFYPLMVGAYCSRLVVADSGGTPESPRQLGLLAFLLFPLGLLTLLKGSALLSGMAISGLGFLLFGYNRMWKYASLMIVVPTISLVFFWMVSGQELYGLQGYIAAILPLASGYTEAMSIEGIGLEVILYTALSVLMLWVIFRGAEKRIDIRVFDVLTFAALLFLVLKAGFVRHDGHALMTGAFILLAALLASAMYRSRSTVVVLLLAFMLWAYIDSHYARSNTALVVTNFKNTYLASWNGLRKRIFEEDWLATQYEQALATIDSKLEFPQLEGTTDIYSYNQSNLIASGNRWNPRPILQSYSAYTPALAELNRIHLLGESAPDNLIFMAEPIDGRMASQEDGPSWLEILAGYEPTAARDDFLILRKRPVRRELPAADAVQQSYALGDVVALPEGNAATYARIDIKQSLLGKLVTTLYKPTTLQITLTLQDGATRTYRLVSGMANSGMLISPLVSSAAEFGLLYAGPDYLEDNRVRSLVIEPSGGSLLWKSEFDIEFVSLELPQNPEVAELFEFEQPTASLAGLSVVNAERCDGGIDFLNGSSPPPAEFSASSLLQLHGWLAMSTENAMLPERVLVVLTNAAGERVFLETRRTSRLDVGAYFGKSELNDSGYAATADVSALRGTYSVGLAYVNGDTASICPQAGIPGNFRGL